jgi:transcription-repair coupling factor (superfamily II helicase)
MRGYALVGLLDRIRKEAGYARLEAQLASARPGEPLGPLGLPEAARPAVIAALSERLDAPLLWLVEQPDEARAVADSLAAYLEDPLRVHVLPAPDAMPYERIPWDPNTRELRLAALTALYRWTSTSDPGPAPLVVAPLRGLLVPTLPPSAFKKDARLLQRGDVVGLTELLRSLARLGYRMVSMVDAPGQMAHRGGIVDLYPPASSRPIRLEWFGDELDSIRAFDRGSQRSQGELDSIMLMPACEALPGRGKEVAEILGGLDARRMHPLAQSMLERHARQLAAGEQIEGIEFYTALLHPEAATVLDFLPPQGWVVIDSPERLATAALGLREQAKLLRQSQVEAGELPVDWPVEPLADWAAASRRIDGLRQLRVGQSAALDRDEGALSQRFGRPESYGGRIEEAVVDIAQLTEEGQAVVLVSRQAARVVEIFANVGLHVAVTETLEQAPGPGGLAVVQGALGSGWLLGSPNGPDVATGLQARGDEAGPNLHLITDGELFGWRMPHRRRQSRAADPSRKLDYFSEYAAGDYVVHIEHGIGLFRGLERMQIGEVERDYLKLEYAAGDVLFVPTHQADRVARYVGTGEIEPAVTRLGTADWERAKSRAKRAVEDIARELLLLYARRENARRLAFAPDTAWQAEMEAAFPFIETDDQMKAIEAVKADMESERPMDRLVVGDVGFGKTEVALRAAFKAVMGGKQVAVLAPTTVLVQQHFETFTRRMMAFPVRIDMLSRFRTKKQQNDIADRMAAGDLDIVIGTHRLLSDDIRFRDLGLLIIDEEQRFGVKHKEKLRQLREGVDTLTLTATPIPRTMHMALTGLRDLTTIDTPPEERLPVVTHVGAYDDNLVRQAIRRELGRRGQVFFVHNRVRGIEMVAQKVEKLVPEARVGIAHGQMSQASLAHAMLDFVGGNVDVLVCTSIIESGLDIPNANTLIVDRADRFGLAQLHQLRGRVGRSAQRAYAYLLHPSTFELPDDARERLRTMAETERLGAGYHIAMRDLELRGAGEILGARQHGQVASIGLDLYTRLLAEAIKKLRADGPASEDTIARELSQIDPGGLPTVDLPVDAFLPERYVQETGERTRIYRRMAGCTSLEAVTEIESELRDRFGAPPWEVQFLIDVLWLRVLAHLAGARSVAKEGAGAVIRWREGHQLSRGRLKGVLPPSARIGNHQVTLLLGGRPDQWLPPLRKALEAIVGVEARDAASTTA